MTLRTRREPPPLLPIEVADREELSSRMLRLTVRGEGVRHLASPGIAASVRLLVPSPGSGDLVMPTWNGNEFLLPDGERPTLRTFTPLRHDPEGDRLDIEIVRHPSGAVSTWAEHVEPGAPAALSGPGSPYTIDPGATRFVVIGDETSFPAITQLVEALSPDVEVVVFVEGEGDAADIVRPDHPTTTITRTSTEQNGRPGATLVAAVESMSAPNDTTRIWAAGEAAAMQAIRTHLHGTLGVPRPHTSIRGYWKPAR